jgi:hypothetical protein
MGLRDKLRRLEDAASEFYGTLSLPDGTEIRYQGEEMLDALLATIDGQEHRLLPYLRQIDTNEGMPGLIRAIEGSGGRGAQG